VRRHPQAAADALAALQQQHLRRARRTVLGYGEGAGSTRPRWGDAPLLNFCGNDYLGLARDPRLTAALTEAARHWGVGSGASHLVTGHTREHQLLEEELAAFTGRESALLFSTGYMANVGVVSALCGRGERLLQDRLQALENEIGQRDQLEGQIDGKMLALFSRLKALEDANVRLEQANEGLRQKAGIH